MVVRIVLRVLIVYLLVIQETGALPVHLYVQLGTAITNRRATSVQYQNCVG